MVRPLFLRQVSSGSLNAQITNILKAQSPRCTCIETHKPAQILKEKPQYSKQQEGASRLMRGQTSQTTKGRLPYNSI